MELLFKNMPIGKVKNTYREQFWIYGEFEAYENFKDYKEFFKAVVNEDGFDEEEFNAELLESENWNVDNDGEIKGIDLPAIYEEGDIAGRYR